MSLFWHTKKPGTLEDRTTEHGTPEHPGTVVERMNITQNTNRTPQNNETIQNEEQLQCF